MLGRAGPCPRFSDLQQVLLWGDTLPSRDLAAQEKDTRSFSGPDLAQGPSSHLNRV